MTDRLERLINLVIALRETRRPMAAEEVRRRVAGYGQDDAETFRRMFERDKADLRAMGVPVETAPLDRWDDTPGYRIDPRHYDLPEISLDEHELAALALALQATGLADDAGAGLRKLAVGAGEPGADRTTDAVPVGVDLSAPHRDALLEAQSTRTRVRFTYRPLERAAAVRTVDPHGLVHRRGRWYLVGHDHDRGQRRAFRLDRIEGSVQRVGHAGAFAAPDADVAVDDVVPASPPGAPRTADVLAAPDVAWQVARRARGGGTLGIDGWSRFTVTVGDPDAFVAWALEYGPELVVLEPAALRARVVAALKSAGAPGGAA